jgi:hypothetical protein
MSGGELGSADAASGHGFVVGALYFLHLGALYVIALGDVG